MTEQVKKDKAIAGETVTYDKSKYTKVQSKIFIDENDKEIER